MKKLFFAILLFNLLLITSCENDEQATITEVNPDLENARLKDFPLSEVSYLDIKITHPEVVNGEERKYGEIEITIPNTYRNLVLSLKHFDLDNNKYSISPSIGDAQDFSKGMVTYTITSNFYEDKAVHYNVNVKAEALPINLNTRISGFKFEQSKNKSLAATISEVKIVAYESYSRNAIYILVPAGTDFSNLTPTVTFDAAKLYYSLGTEFIPYPEGGLAIDFKYPKRVSFQAENSMGERSNTYEVIVDVKDPIEFEQPSITSPNVKTGDGMSAEYFTYSWTNQGNHPITGMASSGYKDKSYPIENYPGNANVITASLVSPVGGTPGVLPGEKGEINIRVNKSQLPGKYKTTAVFTPTFNLNIHTISGWPVGGGLIEGLFDPQELIIESTIEE